MTEIGREDFGAMLGVREEFLIEVSAVAQPIDDERRVGRIGAADEQARELARAVLHEFWDIL